MEADHDVRKVVGSFINRTMTIEDIKKKAVQ